MSKKLFDFIAACPTPYHAAAHIAGMLEKEGYACLRECDDWKLKRGGKYYVTRNRSSVIAFRIPKAEPRGFMMTAAHDDAPTFRLKESAEVTDGRYVRLGVEPYGGAIFSTWIDRPLGIAGRVTVRTKDGLETRLVELKNTRVMIPNVAIHMDRSVNTGKDFNAARDMLPLFGTADKKGKLAALVAKAAGAKEKDIISSELMLYNPQPGTEWGDFISAPRLDDQQCAFATLSAFLAAKDAASVPVCCILDNEECGSTTKQGAAGTFILDTLQRISDALGSDAGFFRRMIAQSFMLSCDNGHAVHPNHPEYADKNDAPEMNKGIVIKFNSQQKYTSDAVSAGIFRLLCDRAGVPYQTYTNRADLPGGGTLGNIANTQVSLNTVDIGFAQLAMHSSYETAGKQDMESFEKALTLFFGSSIIMQADGAYDIV